MVVTKSLWNKQNSDLKYLFFIEDCCATYSQIPPALQEEFPHVWMQYNVQTKKRAGSDELGLSPNVAINSICKIATKLISLLIGFLICKMHS